MLEYYIRSNSILHKCVENIEVQPKLGIITKCNIPGSDLTKSHPVKEYVIYLQDF